MALIEGVVDMLVHSYKDVPTTLPPGCEIAGVLEREDPVDSLVVRKDLKYKTLEDLPDGSVVGTSSVRRVAQLKRKFPKLVFRDVVSLVFACVCGISHELGASCGARCSEETCMYFILVQSSHKSVYSHRLCVLLSAGTPVYRN